MDPVWLTYSQQATRHRYRIDTGRKGFTMRIFLAVVFGVWSLFFGACAVSAVAGSGDVLGLAAFTVLAGLPWLWYGDITGKAAAE